MSEGMCPGCGRAPTGPPGTRYSTHVRGPALCTGRSHVPDARQLIIDSRYHLTRESLIHGTSNIYPQPSHRAISEVPFAVADPVDPLEVKYVPMICAHCDKPIRGGVARVPENSPIRYFHAPDCKHPAPGSYTIQRTLTLS